MKRISIALVMFSCLLLVVGCSKKKEEAAQLEQEVLNGEAGADSVASMIDTTALSDSAAMAAADASAIPAEETAPAMPKRPAGDGFTVQVAGCESEDYARHLVNLYSERGYEPYVSEFSYDDQVYYRVRIGLYDSFGAAKQLQGELSDKYSIDGWIDKVSK